MPKRPSAKHFIGRHFYDEGDWDEDGTTTFEGGVFVVVSLQTGGYVMCVRRDEPLSAPLKFVQKYVRELIVDYEDEGMFF